MNTSSIPLLHSTHSLSSLLLSSENSMEGKVSFLISLLLILDPGGGGRGMDSIALRVLSK